MSFRRTLRLSKWDSYQELLNIVTNEIICRDCKDSRILSHSISEEFLAKILRLKEGNLSIRALNFAPYVVGAGSLSGRRFLLVRNYG